MGNYKFIGKPIDLFAKATVGKCAFIAILSILMGSLLGYMAGEEQASFGKDFMTFYCVIFGVIATVFIIKMLTDYQHLYNVYVLKYYRVEEYKNEINLIIKKKRNGKIKR